MLWQSGEASTNVGTLVFAPGKEMVSALVAGREATPRHSAVEIFFVRLRSRGWWLGGATIADNK
ncbi:hypothetical protein EGI32_14945 [Ferruginibacter sp. HRS2-29]|nr:hypothetical protein [Ferruginibacter sp. HRS2-29]MCP9752260.1 hypothetical protein [Ferruginibacter sp. HRS2-29]